MKAAFLLVVISWTCSVSAECDACFDQICYTKQKIFESAQLSGQIAIDRMDNTLHIHYKDYKSNDYTGMLKLNFDIPKLSLLPLEYTFARAVNQDTGEIYLSSSQGVYIYNTVTRETERFGMFNKTIWHMQYKKRLYYSEYLVPGIKYIDNNRTVNMPGLIDYIVDDFIVDKYDDIYFTSDYMVYRLRSGAIKPTLFSNILYSLVPDKYNNAYFIETGTRTLYKLDYLNDKVKEVGIFGEGSIFRAVFDNSNNIIYCDALDDKIYYLQPNYARCIVTLKTNTSSGTEKAKLDVIYSV